MYILFKFALLQAHFSLVVGVMMDARQAEPQPVFKTDDIVKFVDLSGTQSQYNGTFGAIKQVLPKSNGGWEYAVESLPNLFPAGADLIFETKNLVPFTAKKTLLDKPGSRGSQPRQSTNSRQDQVKAENIVDQGLIKAPSQESNQGLIKAPSQESNQVLMNGPSQLFAPVIKGAPLQVLLVCSGNTCRSPMAQCYLRDLVKEMDLNVNVESRGIWVIEDGKYTASDTAKAVLMKEGKDISEHRAKKIRIEDVQNADVIIVFETSHLETLQNTFPEPLEKKILLNMDIADPHGGDGYEEISQKIQSFLKKLVTEWNTI